MGPGAQIPVAPLKQHRKLSPADHADRQMLQPVADGADLRGPVVSLEAGVEGHSSLRVRLGIEEDLGVHDVICMSPALAHLPRLGPASTSFSCGRCLRANLAISPSKFGQNCNSRGVG